MNAAVRLADLNPETRVLRAAVLMRKYEAMEERGERVSPLTLRMTAEIFDEAISGYRNSPERLAASPLSPTAQCAITAAVQRHDYENGRESEFPDAEAACVAFAFAVDDYIAECQRMGMAL